MDTPKPTIGIIAQHPFLEKWLPHFHAQEVPVQQLAHWNGDFVIVDFRYPSWINQVKYFRDLLSERLNFHMDLIIRKENEYRGISFVSNVIHFFYQSRKINYLPELKVYLMGYFPSMLPLVNAFFAKGYKYFELLQPGVSETEIAQLLAPYLGLEWKIIERHHIVMESANGAISIMGPNYHSEMSPEIIKSIHYFNYLNPKATVIDLNLANSNDNIQETVAQAGLNYLNLNDIFDAMESYFKRQFGL
ncbi:MAG: hypothetical protein NZ480_08740 [Bdellovibrionaceae bacterium]|nr:hypothetical protein [Pseudobdellovibrionaceae bacterium]